ncbi:MAG: hypothetical protein ACI85K_001044 [Hyphomicrobiaceae bacterium]|jgi:hypothetical protein
MSAPITIRPYQPGDEVSLLKGHNQIFPERSLAHWQWKFGNNPTGQVHTMVADHEQEGLVGAYVTLPAHAWIEGQRRIIGQCVDLWVQPQHRRFGARPGLFVNLALAHYEEWGGKGENQNSFHHGWPIATWRIGQKYLKYEIVRDWDFLFREMTPGGFPKRATSDELDVRKVDRFDADVDGLWSEFSKETQLAIIRDQRYLNWRYADSVDSSYELYECRETSSNKLRGIAVVAQRDFVIPNTCFLVDWMVPQHDVDTTTALVAKAEERASALGANSLATLFQHRDPRFLEFQKMGFLVYGTIYFQVVIPFDKHDTHFYKEQWYHTLGDSDLI